MRNVYWPVPARSFVQVASSIGLRELLYVHHGSVEETLALVAPINKALFSIPASKGDGSPGGGGSSKASILSTPKAGVHSFDKLRIHHLDHESAD